MIKNEKQLNKRRAFISACINNPKEGAVELRKMATSLENCRNTNDTIFALSEVLYLSEKTIERDAYFKKY